MRFIHITFAVLSAYRMVELFLMDRITAKLREKFPSYLWTCSRCLSVWAGTAATLACIFVPWLNWPFAISWLYFVHNDWVQAHRMSKRGRQFSIAVNSSGNWILEKNELNAEEMRQIFQKVMAPSGPQAVNGQDKAMPQTQ